MQPQNSEYSSVFQTKSLISQSRLAKRISVHKVDSHSILTWTTRRFLLGPIKPLNSRSFIQDFSYQSSDRSSEEGCYHVEALGPMKRLTSNRAHVTKVRVATCLWPAAHVVAHDSFFHFIANAWPHCVWSKFRFSHCVQQKLSAQEQNPQEWLVPGLK